MQRPAVGVCTARRCSPAPCCGFPPRSASYGRTGCAGAGVARDPRRSPACLPTGPHSHVAAEPGEDNQALRCAPPRMTGRERHCVSANMQRIRTEHPRRVGIDHPVAEHAIGPLPSATVDHMHPIAHPQLMQTAERRAIGRAVAAHGEVAVTAGSVRARVAPRTLAEVSRTDALHDVEPIRLDRRIGRAGPREPHDRVRTTRQGCPSIPCGSRRPGPGPPPPPRVADISRPLPLQRAIPGCCGWGVETRGRRTLPKPEMKTPVAAGGEEYA